MSIQSTSRPILKRLGWFLLALFLACSLGLSGFGSAACAHAQELGFGLAPVSPEYEQFVQSDFIRLQSASGGGLGFIPPRLDRSHLQGLAVAQPFWLLGYPVAYDLRAEGRVTPVRDQGACGACWTFGAYASLESYLLAGEERDFSENHMKNTHGFDWGPCSGGNFDMATAYLARWSGPLNEDQDPYSAGPPPAGYYPLGDESPQKHVQRVRWIPGRAHPLDNDNIKWALQTLGAVSAAYYHDNRHYRAGTYSYHYPWAGWQKNYAVAIVGWDDNFSKDNFETAPAGDGAFIVKNSWGTGWGDAGYFYISYYDTRLGYFVVFDNAEPVNNYAAVYQHDPLGLIDAAGIKDSDAAWGANVFTASAGQTLKAVGFYALALDTAYQIRVYTGVDAGASNPPVSGSLAAYASGTLPYPGYHTVAVPEVPLAPGAKFSVVLRLTTPGYNYPLPLETRVGGYSSGAAASPGESYISANGSTWLDLTSWIPNANVCIKAFADPLPPVPAVESVVLNPTSHVAGTAQDIEVTVTTGNVGDGAAVTAAFLREDGTSLDPAVTAGGTVTSGSAALTLSVGDVVPAGTYKVRVSVAGVADPHDTVYVITAPAGGGGAEEAEEAVVAAAAAAGAVLLRRPCRQPRYRYRSRPARPISLATRRLLRTAGSWRPTASESAPRTRSQP